MVHRIWWWSGSWSRSWENAPIVPDAEGTHKVGFAKRLVTWIRDTEIAQRRTAHLVGLHMRHTQQLGVIVGEADLGILGPAVLEGRVLVGRVLVSGILASAVLVARVCIARVGHGGNWHLPRVRVGWLSEQSGRSRRNRRFEVEDEVQAICAGTLLLHLRRRRCLLATISQLACSLAGIAGNLRILNVLLQCFGALGLLLVGPSLWFRCGKIIIRVCGKSIMYFGLLKWRLLLLSLMVADIDLVIVLVFGLALGAVGACRCWLWRRETLLGLAWPLLEPLWRVVQVRFLAVFANLDEMLLDRLSGGLSFDMSADSVPIELETLLEQLILDDKR